MYIGTEDAVNGLVKAWRKANLGVGAKIHIIQKHLLPMMDNLEDDEGLGKWSEQAMESSHGAFRPVYGRYVGKRDALYFSVLEYNYLRM